ncbi:TIM barrel protein (plasmid) [Agrobacterium vitis]|uniref:hydroxypyruvate isomerase family protein n=1 Tax=Agrobacterium vitis TaxID=373 RepID=UPI0012E99260|nr:TIM barrel protein [Agrobacterium vitis]MVA27307.1 TIM barrel protein [Agrobacterium vitis]
MPHVFGYSAHLGYLFTDLTYFDRFRAAKRHGFSAVEHPSPYHVPAARMAEWLEEIDLPYVQFGLYSGEATRGEKGLAIFPDRRSEFRDSVGVGLDYAQTIGVKKVHAMAGVLPKSLRTAEHWDCYIDNLSWAADRAAERDITILVEAMSAGAVADYFVDLPDIGVKAIEATGRDNIRLLLDVFHCVNSGLDPLVEIEKNAELIGHVHIADHPGRHEPGTGTIDFGTVRDGLVKGGYNGFLGCEYSPRQSTVDGLGWLSQLV